MKCFAVLLAATSVCSAAEFMTGQGARALIGQTTFTSSESGTSNVILGGVGGIAYVNKTLFVADSNRIGSVPQNNRILIYQHLPDVVTSATAPLPDSFDRCQVCTGTADLVLGQPDFTTSDIGLTNNRFRTPTAVASDGNIFAVADTDNNRVLIWNSIPANVMQPADVVVGQPDFKTATSNFGAGNTPSAKGMRGPQGVWIQSGKLYVADTQNHRVLIWNSIPTQNGQPADVVLGQPNFSTFSQPDLTHLNVDAHANNLLNPVSVTSDGTRLYVSDLGHNRVLIWNTIPTTNQAPADLAVGQPDVNSSTTLNAGLANNSSLLCASNGTDPNNNNAITYPALCANTLSFPRFALSDGKRLFIADGGNDRVLVYNSVPVQNGQAADEILGQVADTSTEGSDPLRISAADTLRTPTSLAWDGTNLFVADTVNRRIMVFSIGENSITRSSIRNAASQVIYPVGNVALSGSIKEGDVVTITIGGTPYKYTIVKTDSFDSIIRAFLGLINANGGDANVLARENPNQTDLILTARTGGPTANPVSLAVTLSTGATIVATTSGSTLSGAQDAQKIAPGTIVSILGTGFTGQTAAADPNAQYLPRMLGNVQVFFDGFSGPLQYVSPNQINVQVPYEVADASSISAYVRTTLPDGTVKVSTAIAVPIVTQNPGIFAVDGPDPRVAIALHSSSSATGVISVDGSVKAGEVGSIIIGSTTYSYTVLATDTLGTIRDAFVSLINADPNQVVTALASSSFTRIRLFAKVPGTDGEGISFSVAGPSGGSLLLSVLGSSTLCCSNTAYAPVTPDNPAKAGETILVYATGLGVVQPSGAETGRHYDGPVLNEPNTQVDALIGGQTANVLAAGIKAGQVGVHEVALQLNSALPTNPQTQLTIAQDIYVSNIVTIPVVSGP